MITEAWIAGWEERSKGSPFETAILMMAHEIRRLSADREALAVGAEGVAGRALLEERDKALLDMEAYKRLFDATQVREQEGVREHAARLQAGRDLCEVAEEIERQGAYSDPYLSGAIDAWIIADSGSVTRCSRCPTRLSAWEGDVPLCYPCMDKEDE